MTHRPIEYAVGAARAAAVEARTPPGYIPGGLDRWFVYIARCSDGSLYVGIARDVAARIAQHDAGRGARYTRGRGPLALVAKRRCESKGSALRLELALKRLSRSEKLAVAASRRRLATLARACAARPVRPGSPPR
jgi:putative endonuclease